ncbi:hypothetical protein [Thioalkalivibrio sp. ALMg11]|uniref:hypothetical protein n=1 Tax=Thioalkalivibrio sp. ALMg11 TaxID=1158165 RepID=UPI000380171B|nr:hypothetical protein [Thioalkalivibrio sp. ALMg11]
MFEGVRDTGLRIRQDPERTRVYQPEVTLLQAAAWKGNPAPYQEYPMPHARYSLAADDPGDGVAGFGPLLGDLERLLRAG